MSVDDEDIEASRAPLLSHLVELRSRLIICCVAFIVAFGFCFAFAEPITAALIRPYTVAQAVFTDTGGSHGQGAFDLVLGVTGLKSIPAAAEQAPVITTGLLELFFAKMKIAAFGAIVLSFPVLAAQLYRFVAPGLYRKERRAFLPFLLVAPVLFLLGAALVYFIMLPFVLWFSLSQQIVAGDVRVELLPRVADYLELVTKLILAFGLCFQLPVVLTLAGLAGMVTTEGLAKFRRYAIVAIVFVAAIVTPPDPLSQIMLAIPIYLLYEISIWCVRVIETRRKREESTEIVPI